MSEIVSHENVTYFGKIAKRSLDYDLILILRFCKLLLTSYMMLSIVYHVEEIIESVMSGNFDLNLSNNSLSFLVFRAFFSLWGGLDGEDAQKLLGLNPTAFLVVLLFLF